MLSAIVFIICASMCLVAVVGMKLWSSNWYQRRREIRREMKDLDQEYEDLLKRLNLHGV